jgi:hypothetical protein
VIYCSILQTNTVMLYKPNTMKKLLPILTLLIIGLSACKKDEVNTRFDDSYKAWSVFKRSSANSYTYTAFNGSVFGSYIETKFTINAGKITKREFLSGRYPPNADSLIINKQWVEDSSHLDTHGTEAHALLTLDAVYNKAKKDWLSVNKKDNDVYLEANNNGIISSAGYVPKGCMDDCFNGIHIKDVIAL